MNSQYETVKREKRTQWLLEQQNKKVEKFLQAFSPVFKFVKDYEQLFFEFSYQDYSHKTQTLFDKIISLKALATKLKTDEEIIIHLETCISHAQSLIAEKNHLSKVSHRNIVLRIRNLFEIMQLHFTQEYFSLENLPFDLRLEVLKQVDVQSRGRIAQISKMWNNHVQEDRVWKADYDKFGIPIISQDNNNPPFRSLYRYLMDCIETLLTLTKFGLFYSAKADKITFILITKSDELARKLTAKYISDLILHYFKAEPNRVIELLNNSVIRQQIISDFEKDPSIFSDCIMRCLEELKLFTQSELHNEIVHTIFGIIPNSFDHTMFLYANNFYQLQLKLMTNPALISKMESEYLALETSLKEKSSLQSKENIKQSDTDFENNDNVSATSNRLN